MEVAFLAVLDAAEPRPGDADARRDDQLAESAAGASTPDLVEDLRELASGMPGGVVNGILA